MPFQSLITAPTAINSRNMRCILLTKVYTLAPDALNEVEFMG